MCYKVCDENSLSYPHIPHNSSYSFSLLACDIHTLVKKMGKSKPVGSYKRKTRRFWGNMWTKKQENGVNVDEETDGGNPCKGRRNL